MGGSTSGPVTSRWKTGFLLRTTVTTQGAKHPDRACIKADRRRSSTQTELAIRNLCAPFDGAPNSVLDVGNIIPRARPLGFPSEPNALVVINQVQPIRCMFTLVQIRHHRTFRAGLSPGSGQIIAFERRRPRLSLIPACSPRSIPQEYHFRNDSLKAIFPIMIASGGPRLFVNVRVVTQVQDNGLPVPP